MPELLSPPPHTEALAAGAWRYELARGARAEALSAALATNAFQHRAWVRAVAAARGRTHEFVAVQAQRPDSVSPVLFGGLHRRAGLAVFESMPMGGYGGWVCDGALSLDEERALTASWLRQAPWPLVRLTSEPGRAAALPQAAVWPLPRRLQRRLQRREFETHVLDLSSDDAQRLQRVKPSVRSYLRRVDALGFEFLRGGEDALAAFGAFYRRGSLGWVVASGALLPEAFFSALHGDGRLEVWRARRDGRLLASAAFLLGCGQVQYQASGSDKVAGPVSAMDALLWTAAGHYRARGFNGLNLGASEGLDSVRRFKEKFGAQPLAYRCETYLMPRLAGRLGLGAGTKASP